MHPPHAPNPTARAQQVHLFRLHLEGGTSQQPFKSCLAFLRIGTKQTPGVRFSDRNGMNKIVS